MINIPGEPTTQRKGLTLEHLQRVRNPTSPEQTSLPGPVGQSQLGLSFLRPLPLHLSCDCSPVTPPIKECHRRKPLMVASSLHSLDLGMMQGWKVDAEMFRFPRMPLDAYIAGSLFLRPRRCCTNTNPLRSLSAF